MEHWIAVDKSPSKLKLGAAFIALGSVHGSISFAHEHFSGFSVIGIDTDSNTGRNL